MTYAKPAKYKKKDRMKIEVVCSAYNVCFSLLKSTRDQISNGLPSKCVLVVAPRQSYKYIYINIVAVCFLIAIISCFHVSSPSS
mmetsp:Transcript_33968/g.49843  ORF Transcript_33968/g.49843 Transcript_33968/m.49843 type:complete len:84 (+) Transcript_33968:323-574(+)